MAIVRGASAAPALDPADVDERTYRGSGPGGQHRNKVETGVALLHRPTGIEAKVDRGRSQWQNRAAAWAELDTRVRAYHARIADGATNDARVEQIGVGDRPSHDWTWTAWRDQVTHHGSGRKWPMAAALRGRWL